MAFRINGSNLRQNRKYRQFRFHPSTKNIKRKNKITSKFFFKIVLEEFVKDIVNDLSSNKAAVGEIALKILKKCDFSFHFLRNCINEAIKNKNSLTSQDS